MWGIEALNGIQSFDSGVTRVRLPVGVAPIIVKALEEGGAVSRGSTHATGTKLVNNGLGKDIDDEKLRALTPRGMGALLVIPTSQDGTGGCGISDNSISGKIKSKDYDLVLKREDYGFNDALLHTRAHSRIGFYNYLTELKDSYKEGKGYIFCKSALAKMATTECGKGEKVHRKEHLSELKSQSTTLVSLLDAGKKEGLFGDFKTTWVFRMQWPPFEKKIVASDPNSRKGLGNFLRQLADAAETHPQFTAANQANINKVSGLLLQARAEQSGTFQRCREGNEVLVNCEMGRAVLLDSIAKSSGNDPVQRDTLVLEGMISERDPEGALGRQQTLKESFWQLRSQKQSPLDNAEDAKDESGPKHPSGPGA